MLGATTDAIVARYGWAAGLRLAAQLRLTKLLPRSVAVRVDVPFLAHPIHLRPRTSDRQVLQELMRETAFDWLDRLTPRFLVDAGANIGLVSALFATHFPNATIAALELDPGNFRLLERNVAAYPRVRPLLAGLWSHHASLVVENPHSAPWGYRARESDVSRAPQATGREIRAITVADVIEQFGVAEIDVLKIDIEGGEREVFSRDTQSWLPRVRCLVIELHDRLVPGCSAAVRGALGDEFVAVHTGELHVYARRDVAAAVQSSRIT